MLPGCEKLNSLYLILYNNIPKSCSLQKIIVDFKLVYNRVAKDTTTHSSILRLIYVVVNLFLIFFQVITDSISIINIKNKSEPRLEP